MNHRHRFQLLYFLFQDTKSAFHAVGAVGGKFEPEGEEPELVVQTFHVRVVPLCFVKNKVPLPVERFQVRLDTCGLFGLPVLIRMNI